MDSNVNAPGTDPKRCGKISVTKLYHRDIAFEIMGQCSTGPIRTGMRLNPPLGDHGSAWVMTGLGKLASRCFVVYHAYTQDPGAEPRTLLQIEYLRNNLKHRGQSCLVVRDALWGLPTLSARHQIKQVFIFGEAVDQELVLSQPYDFADCRCFEPK